MNRIIALLLAESINQSSKTTLLIKDERTLDVRYSSLLYSSTLGIGQENRESLLPTQNPPGRVREKWMGSSQNSWRSNQYQVNVYQTQESTKHAFVSSVITSAIDGHADTFEDCSEIYFPHPRSSLPLLLGYIYTTGLCEWKTSDLCVPLVYGRAMNLTTNTITLAILFWLSRTYFAF